jgi:hypothetical protein
MPPVQVGHKQSNESKLIRELESAKQRGKKRKMADAKYAVTSVLIYLESSNYLILPENSQCCTIIIVGSWACQVLRMLFNLKVVLGFLLKKGIKDEEGVFSNYKLGESPLTQVRPFWEESPNLFIPKRKPCIVL